MLVMEFFKFFIFGIAGVSVIFWVAVVALWHTYMFPRIFQENGDQVTNDISSSLENINNEPILGSLVINESLPDRKKYSMKSMVVADFNSLNNLKLDSLYTLVSVGVVFASFTMISYGLHSAFPST
tara:strand:- start:65 stop:442 length:378 start_codon:yes stop_codon:yes gene_type:complete